MVREKLNEKVLTLVFKHLQCAYACASNVSVIVLVLELYQFGCCLCLCLNITAKISRALTDISRTCINAIQILLV